MSDSSTIPLFPDGPPDWPFENPAVNESVHKALADGSWGKYDSLYCNRLEDQLAAHFNFKHVMLVSSGTIATEIALKGVAVREKSNVALAAYDFPGNFRSIESVNAFPCLIDINQDAIAMSAESLQEAIEAHDIDCSAAVVSHLHGSFAAIEKIQALSQKHGFSIVEDLCQSPGGILDGKKLAQNCDVATLSFGGSKLLTAGRGGAVLTNSEQVFQRMKIYCDRGNHAFPLSELQAAALLPQLDQLQEMNQRRFTRAKRIADALKETWPPYVQFNDHNLNVLYKLPWMCETFDREQACSILQQHGLAVFPGFRGFTKRSPRRCLKPVDLGNAQKAVGQLAILHHPILSNESCDVERIAEAFMLTHQTLMN